MAFNECGNLSSVTIPNSVKTIGRAAFYGSGLDGEIIIPNSVKSIGEQAFDYCYHIDKVIIENKKGNVLIGENAFPSGVKITYTK